VSGENGQISGRGLKGKKTTEEGKRSTNDHVRGNFSATVFDERSNSGEQTGIGTEKEAHRERQQ